MGARTEVQTMPSKKTAAKLGAGGAIAIARHPTLRRATVRAGAPTAKVGWRVGKVVARRKLRGQVERIGAAGRSFNAFWVVYGPIAAEVLGLVEAPKPKRRAPVFAAGALTGAAASYVLLRQRRG
jgi:hypothetical protein